MLESAQYIDFQCFMCRLSNPQPVAVERKILRPVHRGTSALWRVANRNIHLTGPFYTQDAIRNYSINIESSIKVVFFIILFSVEWFK